MAALFSEDFILQALWGLFVAVTLFQMVFSSLLLFFFSDGKKKGGAPFLTQTGSHPGVSVIVCARNEAPNLQKNLPHLLFQEYPGAWELIVVNDASTDQTQQVLSDFERQFPRLRTLDIHEKNAPGKKHALGMGIRAARFEIVLLTDADCCPESRYWVQHMTAPLAQASKHEIVLGYGPMQRSAIGGFLEKWCRFETAFTAIQYCSLANMGIPYMGVGRNLAFRRQVFERVGGFSRHQHLLSGDDDLLVNAAAHKGNTTCCLHRDAFVYSESKKTWAEWLRQKRRHLSASAGYKRRHKLLLAGLSMAQVLHYFLVLLLAVSGFAVGAILCWWLARLLLLMFLFRRFFGTLQEADLWPLFPVFDVLLAVYYGVVTPVFLMARQVRSWV